MWGLHGGGPGGQETGRRERGAAGGARLRPWALVEPRDTAVDMESGGGRDRLHVGLRHTPIPRPSQANGAAPLRPRPFDARPPLRARLPAARASQVCAAASAWSWSRGGSRSRRPGCGARGQQVRTGHVPPVCWSPATMRGRLPCPPPCSHHATDRGPWGQRPCCCSQSPAPCSRVSAPSPCVCHPWRGRGGPRRAMPWSSRRWTRHAELRAAASPRGARGALSGATRACGRGGVPGASWTEAGVVWTCVSRWGAVGSPVALPCPLEPVHGVSRVWRERASAASGAALPSAAGGNARCVVQRTR